HRRRAEPPRPGGRRRGGLRVRGGRSPSLRHAGRRQRPSPGRGCQRAGAPELMEALLLAGGKAERLGEAAQGLPKPLVPVAGYPLAEYTVARLVGAGVTRVIVSCRAGAEDVFVNALAGLGAEIEAVGEEEPLGRGGG